MNKKEFLSAIRQKLTEMTPVDAERSLDYYAEMIDDRVEDGLTEAEAVAEMESVDVIAAQILAEAHAAQNAHPLIRVKRKLLPWQFTMLIAGSPLWIALAVAAVAVVLAIYVVIWSVILVCYAADLALAAAALGCIFSGALSVIQGQSAQALIFAGAALVCAGLAIVLFYGCIPAAKGAWRLSKLIWRGIRALFTRKEEKA